MKYQGATQSKKKSGTADDCYHLQQVSGKSRADVHRFGEDLTVTVNESGLPRYFLTLAA